MQNELFAAGQDSVSGVGATLKAGDNIGPFGQQVHNLAFALVAPLAPDHNNIFFHMPIPYPALMGLWLNNALDPVHQFFFTQTRNGRKWNDLTMEFGRHLHLFAF